MRAQTHIFAMTVGEALANLDTVTSTMFVFGTSALVLFDSRSSRSSISIAFALHADRELTLLKNKLIVTTPLGEQILRNTIFKDCEILVEGVILMANWIPLEIHDFDVTLGIDWLSTHRALMDYFTKKVVFQKPGYPELKFEGD